MNSSKQHFSTIVALRALAALSVCLFHFTKGYMDENGWIRDFFRHGWMGVEVFFVISGFVIPYSLFQSNFRFKHYGLFIKKRLLRIEPAYLISLLLILILNYSISKTSFFLGKEFSISSFDVLLHLGYLVEFFDAKWLNDVYWTLAVEFHYYILIGVLVALWKRVNIFWFFISISFLIMFSHFPISTIKLTSYTNIFALGLIACQFKIGKISQISYLIVTLLISLSVYLTQGSIVCFVTLITSLLITLKSNVYVPKWLIYLGEISFSLYLLHTTVGGKFINLCKRLSLSEPVKFLVVIMALLLSIFVSRIFYKIIEKPSHMMSRKMKFE